MTPRSLVDRDMTIVHGFEPVWRNANESVDNPATVDNSVT